MKKILAYILCLALLATALVGCGSKEESDAPEKETSSSEQVLEDETKEESEPEEKQEEQQEEQEEPKQEEPSDPTTTEKPKNQVPAWKTAYLKFIEKNKGEYEKYALVYIDNDNIPELYLNGSYEAVGDAVCSYKNGKLITQHLNRTGGGSYIPKGGLIFNFNGNMGYYTANVYKLTNKGFTNIFTGSQQERMMETDDEQYDIEYDFFVGDKQVSEEEFYEAIEDVFSSAKSRSFYSSSVSYSRIKEKINNFK